MADAEDFVLDLDGFEGPIDLLLSLARAQKVDLARISILQLAEQYLDYIRRARLRRLEIAADYLVMAAWLAYLKSRLLLPAGEDDAGKPSAEALAEALAFRLRKLEAMRDAAARLMAGDLLGRDVFPRGLAETTEVVEKPVFAVALADLVAAYADRARRGAAREALRVAPAPLPGLEEAARRMSALLGAAADWTALSRFLPDAPAGPLGARAALASALAASLELARSGRVEIRQAAPFAPVFLRRGAAP